MNWKESVFWSLNFIAFKHDFLIPKAHIMLSIISMTLLTSSWLVNCLVTQGFIAYNVHFWQAQDNRDRLETYIDKLTFETYSHNNVYFEFL